MTFIWDCPFSTYAKLSKKLTFLTPQSIHFLRMKNLQRLQCFQEDLYYDNNWFLRTTKMVSVTVIKEDSENRIDIYF